MTVWHDRHHYPDIRAGGICDRTLSSPDGETLSLLAAFPTSSILHGMPANRAEAGAANCNSQYRVLPSECEEKDRGG
jgi:hypothetical protein